MEDLYLATFRSSEKYREMSGHKQMEYLVVSSREMRSAAELLIDILTIILIRIPYMQNEMKQVVVVYQKQQQC